MQPLEETIDQLWQLAQASELDPFPVIFELVPSAYLYEVAAYGMPGHYRHWSYGKQYYQMKNQYNMGQSRIFELVINTNPAQAYLLENNPPIYHKMVAAHVFGHSDFFKNNTYFEPTNRRMPSIFAAHRDRLMEYEQEHGLKRVESLLDRAHALRYQRPVTPIMTHNEVRSRQPVRAGDGTHGKEASANQTPFEPYAELFPERTEAAETRKKNRQAEEDFEREDLLKFLIEESDTLEDWERDLLSIVREEHSFFLPQMVTKLMNEGWATYWHTQLMERLSLTDEEMLDYARVHSGVARPHPVQVNPYYVGWKMFEDIVERLGMEEAFRARAVHRDASFIRQYLTDDLIEALDLYVYSLNNRPSAGGAREAVVESKDPAAVRNHLADIYSHYDIPPIKVDAVKSTGRLELILDDPEYSPEEHPLKKDEARRVLKYLQDLWGDPVVLKTPAGTLTAA